MAVVDRIALFIDHKGMSMRSFDHSIDATSGYFSRQLKRGGGIGSEILEKISEEYPNLNMNWLFTGDGEMLKDAQVNAQVNAQVTEKNAAEPAEPYFPKVEQVDTKHNKVIPISQYQASAGYGILNNEYLETEEFIQLPPRILRGGDYLGIISRGDSMAPTIQDQSLIINRFIQPGDWINLRDRYIHVVVTKDGQAHLKRIKNRFGKYGQIVCMSDNPDKATYPNFNIDHDEIVSIWESEIYISKRMPNVHQQFYGQLQTLEDRFDELENKFNQYLPNGPENSKG